MCKLTLMVLWSRVIKFYKTNLKKSYEQHFKLKNLKTHRKSIISFCLHESYKLRNSVVILNTSTTWLQDDKCKIRLMRIYKVPVNKSEPSCLRGTPCTFTYTTHQMIITSRFKQYIHSSLTDVGLPNQLFKRHATNSSAVLNLVEVKVLRKCVEFPRGDGVLTD